MAEPRKCYAVFETQFHPERGFVPSLVVEDEPGHTPLVGSGEEAQPWYWGKDLAQAKRICDDANAATFGLTPEQARDIVESSIRAQFQAEAAQREAQARVDKALGRFVDDRLGREPLP